MIHMGDIEVQMLSVPHEHTLCFAGHRPVALPKGGALAYLQQVMQEGIEYAIAQGYTHFMTGLADGVDLMAADLVLLAKRQDERIQLIGVSPCENYEEFFRLRHYNLAWLRSIQLHLDMHIIMPGSHRDARVFVKRNHFMVEHASAILGVVGKPKSGSQATITYAKQLGLRYWKICLDPQSKEFSHIETNDPNWDLS